MESVLGLQFGMAKFKLKKAHRSVTPLHTPLKISHTGNFYHVTTNKLMPESGFGNCLDCYATACVVLVARYAFQKYAVYRARHVPMVLDVLAVPSVKPPSIGLSNIGEIAQL